jgi:2-hydroxy-6-oxonona-2,4-dienedioate hydrolase
MEVRQIGSGPPVLIVHGTPGGWDAALEAAKWLGLDRGFRLILPSRPGYLGTPIETGRTMGEQADAIARMLSAPVAVVAISGGGPAGCLLAARHPQLVSRLALLCALTDRDQRWRWPEQILVRTAPLLAWIPSRLLRMALPVGLRREGFLNDDTQFRQLPDLELERIGCPTLIVHGSWDTAVSIDSARRAARRIPGARFVEIPRGSHLAPLTQKTGSLVRSFLIQ